MADKGHLTVDGPFEITDVRVFDAGLREVAAGTHSVSAQLDPGIYRVVAQVPGSSQEKLVVVEPGKQATVGGFTLDWDSVTPHEQSRSHHEYQTDPAQRMSRQTHADLGGDARLFVYARTDGGPATGAPSFRLLNSVGGEIAAFPLVGEHDAAAGWLGCSLTLPPGTYQLEHTVPGLGPRAQAIFVDVGWQTQVFAPWRGEPDFGSAVLHMRPSADGFQPKNFWEFTRTEAALNGLADRRVILHPDEINDFLDGKFWDPMLGLVGAYALLVQGDVDYSRLDLIAENLLRLLPHSPDAALLRFIATSRGVVPPAKPDSGWPAFTEPPLFAIGCDRLLDLASRVKELCPADSWLGRISMSLSTGSTWTRWDPTLNATEALTKLKNEINATIHESQKFLDSLVHDAAGIVSATTFGIMPHAQVVPFLTALVKQTGPPLVKWLEEVNIVDIRAMNDRVAQRMAVNLAPQLQLPQSVTEEALRKLLNEAIPSFRAHQRPAELPPAPAPLALLAPAAPKRPHRKKTTATARKKQARPARKPAPRARKGAGARKESGARKKTKKKI